MMQRWDSKGYLRDGKSILPTEKKMAGKSYGGRTALIGQANSLISPGTELSLEGGLTMKRCNATYYVRSTALEETDTHDR